jgi:predicted nucleic acid-binding protein
VSLIVVDANVAAKWFLPPKGEMLTDEAFRLFRRYAQGEIRFIVPDLFWAELVNVLWKAVRNGRCSNTAAETGLASLIERKLPTVPSLTLLDVAFRIATAFDRNVYDGLHVALAMHSKAQLVTADVRLANSLAAHFPVKWLGAL